jgi:CRP-like cAMP-binding protein
MVVAELGRHELFELLNPKEMEGLSNVSGVVKLREGQRICREGAPASHLFVLLSGRAELRRPAGEGLGLLVDVVTAGSIVGVSALMGTERYLLDAKCMEDSEVLKVEARVLRRILDENPLVGYAIQRRISQIFFQRYVEAMERLQTVAQAIPLSRA